MNEPVLILVTHLLGVGHLTRAAALARGLARAGHAVTLVSGGRPARLVDVTATRFVQLPPVHCRGGDFSTLLSDEGRPVGEALRAARIEAILAAYRATRPAVVVTETYPFGRRQLAAEFRALLEAAAGETARPAILASVRDILNPPSTPEKAAEAARVIGRFYDGVLVHGDEALAPLSASWPAEPAITRRLRYTGYVAEAEAPPAGSPPPAGEVLVSGGNSAASLPLYEAAAEAARLDAAGRPWRILVGHGVEEPDFAALAAKAHPRARIERARPDFSALLSGAAVSVSQAGYNTAVDLARARRPAVLVPYEEGAEAEQSLRAGRLAAKGLAVVLRQEALTPDTLAQAVEEALALGAPEEAVLTLDGVPRSVAAIREAGTRAREEAGAWARLRAALDDLGRRGGHLDLWWRDDDAERPTPALDRLLALARRHGAPLALAVSPDLATGALAERLADEPLALVLMHGVAHRNHAPPGERRRELGFRPEAVVLADLGRALPALRARFGARMRPVLVPPWNRIDEGLVPHLNGLGLDGLSTFGSRPAPRLHGLAVANTHIDPIEWRGGGGLRPLPGLLDGLAARLGQSEPVGLLTHHLVHDEWIWRFVEALLALLSGHPAVRLRSWDALAGTGAGGPHTDPPS